MTRMFLRCDELEMPLQMQQQLGNDVFDRVMNLQGEIYRDVPGRRTIRVQLAGSFYFIKQHFGTGWKEIFKNLLSLRLPIVSAATEARAIRKLDELGIPTTPLMAYGCRGNSPASLKSFVITKDLGDIISLETLCADWQKNPPDLRFKRRLIKAVAELARKLHDNGLNHRDFYICHLCLDRKRLENDEIYLYLIDLHRVGIRHEVKPIDRMKDMAALYFSAMDAGLTRQDYFWFLRIYRQKKLHQIMNTEGVFWRRVSKRAEYLHNKFQTKYAGNKPDIKKNTPGYPE